MNDTYPLHGTVPLGLMHAFEQYEQALTTNDLAALEALFAPDDVLGDAVPTLRGDGDGLLVGASAIAEFRRSRGGSPERAVESVYVQTLSEFSALVMAEVVYAAGGRGRQTQVWSRQGDTWMITAAHVSKTAPAIDPAVWRIVGAPLLGSTGTGVLDGLSVAVKDLFAIAGQQIGAGNPDWLAQAPVEQTDAAAVAALRSAGATVAGIAQTDEFAYSLAGTNPHSGTPRNVRAPGRISGGSSSGSASAVALGQADIGLGTDTGGSIRVPASYQGLFGIRTTHNAVDRTGLLPLAPSFDTIGWMARTASTLRKAGEVLLPPAKDSETPFTSAVFASSIFDVADADVREALVSLLESWTTIASLPALRERHFDTGVLPGWQQAFRAIQGIEAWQNHGDWIHDRLSTVGADVASRFTYASSVDADTAEAALSVQNTAREMVSALVGDSVLIVPSASSVAPTLDEADRGGEFIEGVRTATLRLTSIAGLSGFPAVSIPLASSDGLPRGACLIGRPGSDHRLMLLAEQIAAAGLLQA
jgi:amidase